MKRLVDIFGAITGLMFFSPAIITCMVLVWLEDKHNPIYAQKRIGLNGVPFTIYKIRSMVHNADKLGDNWTLKNDSRILRVGKFIRSSNIDEFLQLLNVIKGDMSLVGPRPETPEQWEEFKETVPLYTYRKQVKPGLTGLSQMLGYRGDTCIKRRSAFDHLYIKKQNLLLDFWIILKTFNTTKGAC